MATPKLSATLSTVELGSCTHRVVARLFQPAELRREVPLGSSRRRGAVVEALQLQRKNNNGIQSSEDRKQQSPSSVLTGTILRMDNIHPQ